jgi:hypothetical protein
VKLRINNAVDTTKYGKASNEGTEICSSMNSLEGIIVTSKDNKTS